MSGRYPGGANSPELLWQTLPSGVDAIGEATGDRWDLGWHHPDAARDDRVYTRAGGFLDRIDSFDAEFFGISPREARQVGPQHRLLLELGGEGVARGYLHHPELTAERFLSTENLPTAGRLYQTGDLARYRHDGSIEYLGRMDEQVKIRGFRIELGEIENVLRQHPKVKDAVVVMQRDAALDSSLAAYVTASSRPPYPAELLAFQRQHLPSSMVANEIVVLNHLPLTPNGKVDRKALMERRIDTTEKAVVPDSPLTDIERKLASIWEKHFNRSPIGIDEDFFALGGHSLLAFRIFSEIEKRLRAALLLSLLFRAPTIRLLAAEIERQGLSKSKVDDERKAY